MLTKSEPYIREKAWGYELWVRNCPDYCGKILHFNQNSKFSFHYHIKKTETWYVHSGVFILLSKDLKTGLDNELVIKEGDVVHIARGEPHQLLTETGGEIFEISTHHEDSDSYRIAPGNSQDLNHLKELNKRGVDHP